LESIRDRLSGIDIRTILIAAFMAISLLANIYAFTMISNLQARVRELSAQPIQPTTQIFHVAPWMHITSMMNNTVRQLETGDIVTYISDLLTITGLAHIPERPITLNIEFQLNYESSNENASVRLTSTPGYSFEITSQKLDMAECPYSIYPLVIENFNSGDYILFTLHVKVTATTGNTAYIKETMIQYLITIS